jgi:hypothetical protein
MQGGWDHGPEYPSSASYEKKMTNGVSLITPIKSSGNVLEFKCLKITERGVHSEI